MELLGLYTEDTVAQLQSAYLESCSILLYAYQYYCQTQTSAPQKHTVVKQLINTLISSYLAYCNSLFICFLCDFSQILDMWNTTLQFWQSHWLPIHYRIQFKGVFTPVLFGGVLSSIPPKDRIIWAYVNTAIDKQAHQDRQKGSSSGFTSS